MSGIAIASASGSRMPTASPDPTVNEFKDVLPAPPSASREFPRSDTLAVFAEVYDNVGKTPHRVEITAAVLADDGKVVLTTSDERKSEELQGASGGYGYTTKIPLSNLAPGRYVLRLSAKSLLGNSEPVTREVEFRVSESSDRGESPRPKRSPRRTIDRRPRGSTPHRGGAGLSRGAVFRRADPAGPRRPTATSAFTPGSRSSGSAGSGWRCSRATSSRSSRCSSRRRRSSLMVGVATVIWIVLALVWAICLWKALVGRPLETAARGRLRRASGLSLKTAD